MYVEEAKYIFSPAIKLLNFSLGFEALQSLEQLADDVDQVPWDPRRPAGV